MLGRLTNWTSIMSRIMSQGLGWPSVGGTGSTPVWRFWYTFLLCFCFMFLLQFHVVCLWWFWSWKTNLMFLPFLQVLKTRSTNFGSWCLFKQLHPGQTSHLFDLQTDLHRSSSSSAPFSRTTTEQLQSDFTITLEIFVKKSQFALLGGTVVRPYLHRMWRPQEPQNLKKSHYFVKSFCPSWVKSLDFNIDENLHFMRKMYNIGPLRSRAV